MLVTSPLQPAIPAASMQTWGGNRRNRPTGPRPRRTPAVNRSRSPALAPEALPKPASFAGGSEPPRRPGGRRLRAPRHVNRVELARVAHLAEHATTTRAAWRSVGADDGRRRDDGPDILTRTPDTARVPK